jgi:hypothetical protein
MFNFILSKLLSKSYCLKLFWLPSCVIVGLTLRIGLVFRLVLTIRLLKMWIKFCRAVSLASVMVYGTVTGFLPSSLSCSPRLRIVALSVLSFEPYSGSKQYEIIFRCSPDTLSDTYCGVMDSKWFFSDSHSGSGCGSFFGSCMTFFLVGPGSPTLPLTNGSGRHKNLRIQIRNTGYKDAGTDHHFISHF